MPPPPSTGILGHMFEVVESTEDWVRCVCECGQEFESDPYSEDNTIPGPNGSRITCCPMAIPDTSGDSDAISLNNH